MSFKIVDIINLEDEDFIVPIPQQQDLAALSSGGPIINSPSPRLANSSRGPLIDSLSPPFRRSKDGCAYQITKNISAKHYREFDRVPDLPPTDIGGFASYITCSSDEQVSTIMKKAQYYSLHLVTTKASTLCLHGEQQTCRRVTKDCSGIKCCRTSKEICSVPHSGDGIKPFQNIDFDKNVHTNPISDKLELAQQLFFFAQLNFPLSCKHEGKQFHADNVQGRDTYASRQRRSPNWTFRVGYG